jgi:prepilin-type N-terminal cleavage/methylation domain-containing protein
MSAPSTPCPGERGFTLVETLVSLAILTISLVALVEIFGVGFRGVRMSELDAAALHLATSQLARAGTEAPLQAGQQQGTTSGGLEWSVAVEPYVPRDAEGDVGRQGGLEAYWVTAEVRWQSSTLAAPQSMSLKTLKIWAPR